jgi:thiol-disulfide isomerase/thioredoxin
MIARPATRQLRLSLMLAGCLVLLAACSEAPVMQFNPSNRIVLAEFFTFSRCTYCPYAARALDSVATESGDSLVVIAMHRRVAGDTLSPACVEVRSTLYNEAAGGEPATAFDGGPVIRTPGPDYNYETFRNQFLGAKNVRPGAQLEIVGKAGSPACSILVRATGVDSTPTGNLRLFVIIYEDSVRSRMPGNADTIFNHVMRSMLPDENGTAVTLVPADTIRIVERFTLRPFWNPAQLGAVAFVQDMATRKVLQTARCRRL